MKKLLSTISVFTAVFCALSFNSTAATHVVNVQDASFSPSVVNAQCGDIIQWNWSSVMSHTTTSLAIPTGATAWNSPIDAGTPTYTYQVTFPGTYNYECTPHGFLGTINVTCSGCGGLATSLAVTNVSCNGGSNGAIDLSFTVGGGGSYLYAWSNGATTQDIASLSAGSYTVTVLENLFCSLVNSATVNQPLTVLTASISPTDVSCNGLNNGSLNLIVTGGMGPYTYAWSNLATIEDITGLSPNTYSVLVTDNNNCTATALAGIAEPAVLAITQNNLQNVSCFGGNNGSIDMDIAGGTAPYTYAWSNGATTQDLTNLTSGTYSVLITDDNGCTKTNSNSIIEPGTLNISIDNITDATTCNAADGGIDVSVFGGTAAYSYSWMPGGSTVEDIAAIMPGSYTLTVTDANGCTDVATAVVVNANPPIVDLGPDITQCAGSVMLDAGPGFVNYAWSTGASTQTISVSSTGNYSVVVTDGISCTNSDEVMITINSNPVVNLGADFTLCGGGQMLDAGNPGSTYAWSTAATTQTINVSSSGTYSVTVTNAGGCTGTDDIDITIYPGVVINLGPDVTQCGGPVMLDAQNAGPGYAWSTGATTQTITVSASGTYSVVVTDANNCSGSDAVTVTINTNPTVSLGADVTACGSAVLDAGNPGSTYAWSPSGTTQMITALSTGTYSVVVTDVNGCTGSDDMMVTINPNPIVNIGPDVTQCGGNVTLNAGAGVSYAWSTGATTQQITVAAGGNYSVTVTDVNGCSGNDAAMVTFDVMPTVNLGADVTQCGGNVTLNAGNSGSSYLWSDNSTNQTLVVSATGSYSVVVTNTCGSTNDIITVTINPGVVVNLGADVTQCAGNTVLDAGNAGAAYAWSTGATTQTISALASGNYSVTVTDANNCTGTDAVNVFIQALPVVNIGPDATFCGSGMLNAGAQPASTYLWSTSATTQTISVSSSGTYSVVVTNSCGSNSDTAIIVVNTIPTISAGSNVTSCSGGSTTLSASGGATYAWLPGGQTTSSIVVAPTANTTYTVTGTSAGGCTSTSTVSVNVSGPSATTSSTPSNCSANDGTATANSTGGTPPYTYSWTGGQTTQTATGLASGSYTVTVTDAGGCTVTSAASVGTSAPNLQTTFAGGNGQNGNIFDITTLTNVQIVSFDGNLDDAASAGAGGNMEIWYRPGSYVGFEASSVGWTNLGTVFVNPTAIGIPTAIPININLTIPAGQTYAFYVTGNITGCDVDYTNGTLAGNIFAQDANIQIKEGLGKAYPFGASFTPRVWNGRVHYCTGPVGVQQDNVIETTKGVNVYPNPFVSSATVSLTGADLKNGADVIITDVFGREVMTRKVHTAQFEITKDDLPSGVYFYRVNDVNGTVGTGKLVIE